MGRSADRPHLREATWVDVLDWAASEIDALAPAWERRDVLHRFRDGWTVERVTTDHDAELEGRLLRHCLDPSRAQVHDAIASLRDPAGRSQVTLVIDGGELVEFHGRRCSRPGSANAGRIAEFARAAELTLEPDELEQLALTESRSGCSAHH
jgi:hypothetical protein